MAPPWVHPGAVLENGATLEGGAVFLGKNSSTMESGAKIVSELSYVP